LKHLVLDCGYKDDKDLTPFEYDDSRSDLRVMGQLIKDEVKIWVL
jgi:hypothetical protein